MTKKWTFFETCDNCGWVEPFTIVPAEDKTTWTCPRCGNKQDTITECGINRKEYDKLDLRGKEAAIFHMLNEADSDDRV